MNARERIKSLLETGMFRSIAEGKTVQLRIKSGNCDWITWSGEIPQLFDDAWEWRIKPEPREWFVCTEHETLMSAWDVKQFHPTCKVIKVREVLE